MGLDEANDIQENPWQWDVTGTFVWWVVLCESPTQVLARKNGWAFVSPSFTPPGPSHWSCGLGQIGPLTEAWLWLQSQNILRWVIPFLDLTLSSLSLKWHFILILASEETSKSFFPPKKTIWQTFLCFHQKQKVHGTVLCFLPTLSKVKDTHLIFYMVRWKTIITRLPLVPTLAITLLELSI